MNNNELRRLSKGETRKTPRRTWLPLWEVQQIMRTLPENRNA